jgi:hypothetical protein
VWSAKRDLDQHWMCQLDLVRKIWQEGQKMHRIAVATELQNVEYDGWHCFIRLARRSQRWVSISYSPSALEEPMLECGYWMDRTTRSSSSAVRARVAKPMLLNVKVWGSVMLESGDGVIFGDGRTFCGRGRADDGQVVRRGWLGCMVSRR